MALTFGSASDYKNQKRGHAAPQYNVPFEVRPLDVVGAKDLKSAAGTSIGKYWLPDYFGDCVVLAMGVNFVAAGGAQTTAGTMTLTAGGDVITVGGSTATVASVASHSANTVVETSLNNTPEANKLTSSPKFPILSAGELLEWKVGTQGVGAGDQTGYPYAILVRRPSQT